MGKLTISSILVDFAPRVPLNLNLFKQTIRMLGSFQMSIFLMAGWCFLHLSQNHWSYPSKYSTLLYSARHSYRLFSFPLLATGTLRYMRQSNLVDLWWQTWHSTVDFSCPWNRSTTTDLLRWRCIFQASIACSSSWYSCFLESSLISSSSYLSILFPPKERSVLLSPLMLNKFVVFA